MFIRDAAMVRRPNKAWPYEFDLEAFCVFTGQVIAQHLGDQVHARPSFLDEIGNDGDPGFGLHLTSCDDAARISATPGCSHNHAGTRAEKSVLFGLQMNPATGIAMPAN